MWMDHLKNNPQGLLLVEHQTPEGIWRPSYGGVKDVDQTLWLTLAVCRV